MTRDYTDFMNMTPNDLAMYAYEHADGNELIMALADLLDVVVEECNGWEDRASDDHERGCQGRCYDCSCGYDAKRDPLLNEAADTIERLRAALKRMLLEFDFMVENGVIPDVRNDIIFVEARAALEGK